ncbi:MAG: methylmalonyl Co-A mutase-associated GTPase MeaB [Acidimicrobiia bacterium]|nr:methylmalonyl Co-A mutase-associated GTPase MeaB [Acidimicrobiia bacterium]
MLRAALEGDRRSTARLLTSLEDRSHGWRDAMAPLDERSGAAHLVGITGAPGSGKSTLVGALVSRILADGGNPAVVAVDPSSPFTGGSLLGDRIRMASASDPGVMVRSMSARGRLGGLAAASSTLVTAFDALGHDPILIETVGVGQSEVEVVDVADTVVVVVSPEWGDAIQAGKAGIVEIADIFVVNKSDRSGVGAVARALTEVSTEGDGRQPPVISTVATEDRGVDEVVDAISKHRQHLALSGEGEKRRRRRRHAWLRQAIEMEVAARIENPDDGELLEQVLSGSLDPWNAATHLV